MTVDEEKYYKTAIVLVTTICHESKTYYQELTPEDYCDLISNVFFRLCLNQMLFLGIFEFYPTYGAGLKNGGLDSIVLSIDNGWFTTWTLPEILNYPSAILNSVLFMGNLGIISQPLETTMIRYLCNSLRLDIELNGFENIDWTEI